MGATSTHKPAGLKPADYFADYFTHGEIIASAARRNPTFSPGCGDWQYEFYAAVRYLEPHPHAGEVFGFVVLYSVSPGSYYNFTYKDMDETMGPGADNAPRAVLEALTATEHEYANAWRARCWENVKREEAKPRVSRGARIRFSTPLTFTGGFHTSEDTVFEVLRRDELRVVDAGMRVRIPRWRTRDFSVA